MTSKDNGTTGKGAETGTNYGGTQSADPQAADGYQKPRAGKNADNTDQRKATDLGDEYADDSSYGQQEESPETAAGKKGNNAETDAGGSGVR